MSYYCSESCPLCESAVEVFGTDCYPEEGIVAECTNEDCSYNLTLSSSVRVNCLMEAIKVAHNFMVRNFIVRNINEHKDL
jgi:hypothetical protein